MVNDLDSDNQRLGRLLNRKQVESYYQKRPAQTTRDDERETAPNCSSGLLMVI